MRKWEEVKKYGVRRRKEEEKSEQVKALKNYVSEINVSKIN